MSTCLDLSGVCFALDDLYSGVEALYTAEGIGIPHFFGDTEPFRSHDELCYVSWVTGDDQTDEAFTLSAPKDPGKNPRNLFTVSELFTVYVVAYDGGSAADHKAQYRQAAGLRDLELRAIHTQAGNRARLLRADWVTQHVEFRRGAAYRMVFAVEGTVPDKTLSTVQPVPGAFEVEVAGQIENLSISS